MQIDKSDADAAGGNAASGDGKTNGDDATSPAPGDDATGGDARSHRSGLPQAQAIPARRCIHEVVSATCAAPPKTSRTLCVDELVILSDPDTPSLAQDLAHATPSLRMRMHVYGD